MGDDAFSQIFLDMRSLPDYPSRINKTGSLDFFPFPQISFIMHFDFSSLLTDDQMMLKKWNYHLNLRHE